MSVLCAFDPHIIHPVDHSISTGHRQVIPLDNIQILLNLSALCESSMTW